MHEACESVERRETEARRGAQVTPRQQCATIHLIAVKVDKAFAQSLRVERLFLRFLQERHDGLELTQHGKMRIPQFFRGRLHSQ